MAVLITQLLEDLKVFPCIPVYSPSYDDTRLTSLLNGELRNTVTGQIVECGADYFVTYRDIACPQTATEYAIVPTRAAGSVLREVHLVDNASNSIINIPQITVGDLSTRGAYYNNKLSFYIMRNRIYLTGTGNYPNYTLRLYYFSRPAKLVPLTQVAEITAVGLADGNVDPYNSNYVKCTVSAVPVGMAQNDLIDITQGSSPYEPLLEDTAVTDIDGVNIYFPAPLPYGISVGDYISFAGESCTAQIPEEATGVLVQAAVLRFLEVSGDIEGFKLASEKYTQLLAVMKNLLTPRVRGELRTLSPRGKFI